MADFIEFTPEEKIFIAKRIKKRVDVLTESWEKLGPQAKAIMVAVADAVAGLPTQPDKVLMKHRRWWQLRG